MLCFQKKKKKKTRLQKSKGGCHGGQIIALWSKRRMRRTRHQEKPLRTKQIRMRFRVARGWGGSTPQRGTLKIRVSDFAPQSVIYVCYPYTSLYNPCLLQEHTKNCHSFVFLSHSLRTLTVKVNDRHARAFFVTGFVLSKKESVTVTHKLQETMSSFNLQM